MYGKKINFKGLYFHLIVNSHCDFTHLVLKSLVFEIGSLVEDNLMSQILKSRIAYAELFFSILIQTIHFYLLIKPEFAGHAPNKFCLSFVLLKV